MKLLRKIAALPFVLAGNVLLLITIIVIVAAGKVEGVDRLRGLYKEIVQIEKEHEVLS